MTEQGDSAAGRDPIDRWLLRHSSLAVLAVIGAGLAIRIAATRGTYLGSDEAVHFQLVNVSSLAEVYRASLTNAHPPLFFFLLHVWNLVDSSESFLRLLPALIGTAFLGVAYRWSYRLFDRRAAFYSLTALALSPGLVSLSAEVRGYTLLLLLMASALLVLEQAISARSAFAMASFAVLLDLAILTHYSASFLALTAFVYVIIRARRERLPLTLISTWLAFQALTVGLCAFLYWTHIRHLRGSELERAVMNRADYFYPSQEGAFDYLTRQTGALFRSLLGPPGLAVLGLLAFAAGVGLLFRRKRPEAVLLALPFLLAAATGLARIYFYGGTRHSSHLLLFAVAAIGVTGAASHRLWPALLLGALLAGVSWSAHVGPGKRDLNHMNAAISLLRGAAPPGSLLFGDYHSALTVSYSLGGSDYFRENPRRGPFWRSSAGGYRLIGSHEWAFNAKRFSSEVQGLIEAEQLLPGREVWIVHIGAEIDPAAVLSRQVPPVAVKRQYRFGEIAIVRVGIL